MASSVQWDQTLLDINRLVEDHKNEAQNERYRGISKQHFKSSKVATQCSNPSCKSKFTNHEWKYHCFRCGEVFCKQCVLRKMRLNNLAHPDPQGYEYNVCKSCFEKAPQEIGSYRDLTNIFAQYRQYRNDKELSASVLNSQINTKDTLDVETECKRLLNGFKENMMKNDFSRFMHELKTMCCTPEWQKSSLFKTERNQPQCKNCETSFTLTKRRCQCSVCGQSSCQACTSTDLLVFIPDEAVKTEKRDPQLSVIKIVGCPPSEPDICLYLTVCAGCRNHLVKKQVNCFYDQKLEAAMDESWKTIDNVAEKAIKAKLRIESYLPHYQNIVESLEQEIHIPKSGSNRSSVQLVAKGQEDLSDYFTQLVVTIQGLKRMSPETGGQTTVLRNLTTSMCRAYHESMATFRDLRSRLHEVTPLDLLRCIQELVEKNTINGAYLSIRQLAYESIHLCDKHRIKSPIPEKIIAVEEVMYEELKERVVRAKEDWEIHEAVLTEMLQIQLKEHRFIKPSRKLTTKHGAEYVRGFLLERADAVTQRILMQISVKCADKSFLKSKERIETLNEFLATSYHDS